MRAVPNQPKTKMRGVRLADEIWEAIQRESKERGISASDVIREALVRHIERRAAK